MKTITKKEKERLLFYISIVALPLVQFIIFYIVVNFRSILYAFQVYDGKGYSFVWFDTMINTTKSFFTEVKVLKYQELFYTT